MEIMMHLGLMPLLSSSRSCLTIAACFRHDAIHRNKRVVFQTPPVSRLDTAAYLQVQADSCIGPTISGLAPVRLCNLFLSRQLDCRQRLVTQAIHRLDTMRSR
jgi:hypothetical protein